MRGQPVKGAHFGDKLYRLEVTDKSGTKYTYGAAVTLKGSVTAIDGQTKEVVSEWKLTRVEELHGDRIEYCITILPVVA